MTESPSPLFTWRHAVLLLLLLGSLIGLLLHAPIPQDLRYHNFADRRPFLGIPNFFDVASNLPFLFVGLAGLRFVRRTDSVRTPGWTIFFIGVALVSVGSSYYHWSPSNHTLVWDRLPMTIAFMALFVTLLSEFIDERLEPALLIPALLVGAASVFYWQYSDDLRPYAWVQFGPLLVIPALLILFRPSFTHRWLIFVALAGYGLAKLLETFDAQIFSATQGLVAGHAIKHLSAAAACYALLKMVERRKPVSA